MRVRCMNSPPRRSRSPQVEADLDRFKALLDSSPDLDRMIKSPVFSAEDQFKAVAAIADKARPDGSGREFYPRRRQKPPSLRRSGNDRGVPPHRCGTAR